MTQQLQTDIRFPDKAVKNHNPGNLRLSGVRYLGEVEPSDTVYKRFESSAWGYRAVFALLHAFRRQDETVSLGELMRRYALENGSDPERYAAFVTERTGFSPGMRPDTCSATEMVPIVAAMSRLENGTEAVADDVAAGWTLFEQFRSRADNAG